MDHEHNSWFTSSDARRTAARTATRLRDGHHGDLRDHPALLPGLCTILCGVGALADHSTDPTLVGLVVIGLAVGFAGIMLIRQAIRGPRP